MKNYLLLLIILFSFGFNQTYDPETGEIIEDKKPSQVQFDPLTGERISHVQVQSTFQKSYNVRQLAYRDANNNFNTGVTWSVLGGGISLFSIPPLAAFGIALGGDDFGFIGMGWCTYNQVTHVISPIAGKILVFRTHDNKYAKMEIKNFYDTPMTSPYGGFFTFDYVLTGGSTTF